MNGIYNSKHRRGHGRSANGMTVAIHAQQVCGRCVCVCGVWRVRVRVRVPDGSQHLEGGLLWVVCDSDQELSVEGIVDNQLSVSFIGFSKSIGII
jgi:hypothetical protein